MRRRQLLLDLISDEPKDSYMINSKNIYLWFDAINNNPSQGDHVTTPSTWYDVISGKFLSRASNGTFSTNNLTSGLYEKNSFSLVPFQDVWTYEEVFTAPLSYSSGREYCLGRVTYLSEPGTYRWNSGIGTSGNLFFWYNDGNSHYYTLSNTHGIILGGFNVITYTFSRPTLKVYVNGVLKGSTILPSSYKMPTDNDAFNYNLISSLWAYNSGYGIGNVHSFAVWNRALPQSEISDNITFYQNYYS